MQKWFIWLWLGTGIAQEAVIISPITDAFVYSQGPLHNNSTRGSAGMCWAPNVKIAICPRVHQMIYNDRITVIKETNEEVLYTTPSLFYDKILGAHGTSFWIKKDSIAFIPDLTHSQRNALGVESDQLILLRPYYEAISGVWYSTGTRICHNSSRDTLSQYGAILLNPELVIREIRVPKSKAILVSQLPGDRKQFFLNLLKEWARPSSGIIPYVWGGSTYTHRVADRFTFAQNTYGAVIDHCWQRADKLEPHPGFDCSGMIWRAATMAGLSYFYKNAQTAKNHLEHLKKGEHLQEGDLIWYKGHLQVVSDLKRNKLIEASGYKWGWGKVHEISLNAVFRDIATYDQLIDAYQHKKPLFRLCKNPQKGELVGLCVLLKLPQR